MWSAFPIPILQFAQTNYSGPRQSEKEKGFGMHCTLVRTLPKIFARAKKHYTGKPLGVWQQSHCNRTYPGNPYWKPVALMNKTFAHFGGPGTVIQNPLSPNGPKMQKPLLIKPSRAHKNLCWVKPLQCGPEGPKEKTLKHLNPYWVKLLWLSSFCVPPKVLW